MARRVHDAMSMRSSRLLATPLLAALVGLAVGCAPAQEGAVDGGGADVGGGEDDGGEGGDGLVAVAHARELRAVWVASVSRLDFPSRSGLTAAQAEAELKGM